MEIIYFLVKSSPSWENDYHQNFFSTQGAFSWGLIAALIIGVLAALVFYFCFCCSKKSSKYAKISVWAITMLVAAVLGYFCADLVKIGSSSVSNDDSLFRKYSFYYANELYCINKTSGIEDEAYVYDLVQLKDKIRDDLNRYKDVRFAYDITTAVLTIIFFFLTGIIVKRFTINGRAIPFLKP